jgi:isopentenyldiphosphate isomerase
VAELWDVYDVERRPVGRTMERVLTPPRGDYHVTVQLCLFNERGQMLIQRRVDWKDSWPGRWEFSAGGSALAGETSHAAAQRELAEEIGYAADLAALRPAFTLNHVGEFYDFYLLAARPGLDLATLRLQPEEVAAIRWASQEDIHRLIAAEQFVPFLPTLVDFVFEVWAIWGEGPISATTRPYVPPAAPVHSAQRPEEGRP